MLLLLLLLLLPPPCRYLPVLIVGAGQNGDVIPEDANWRQFTAAAAAAGSPQAPVWEVVLRDVGHLQFLDKQLGIFAMFSQPGPVPDELVRRVTQVSRVTRGRVAFESVVIVVLVVLAGLQSHMELCNWKRNRGGKTGFSTEHLLLHPNLRKVQCRKV
jgi:hypothetical protein